MKEILIGFILGLVVLLTFPSLAKSTALTGGQETIIDRLHADEPGYRHGETIFDRLERM